MGPRGVRMSGGVGGYKLHESAAATRSRGIRPTGMGGWLNLHRRLDEAAFERADTPAVQRALAAVEAALRDRGARVLR